MTPLERLPVLQVLAQSSEEDALQEHLEALREADQSFGQVGRALVFLARDECRLALELLDPIEADSLPAQWQEQVTYIKGHALLSLGENENALKVFSAWAQGSGDSPEALVGKSKALMRLRRLEEAEPVLRALVSKDENNFDGQFGLGVLLTATRRYSESLDHLARAQALNPLAEGPYRALCQLFTVLEQPKEGVEFLKGILQMGFLLNSPAVLMDLIELHQAAGIDEGLDNYLNIVERTADLGPAEVMELGRCWYELRRPEELKRLAGRMNAENGGVEEGMAKLLNGLAIHLEGESQRAAIPLAEAAELAPSLWLTYERLAALALEMGDSDRARDYVSEALKRAPHQPDTRVMEGIVQIKVDPDSEARSFLEHISRSQGVRAVLRERAKAALQ